MPDFNVLLRFLLDQGAQQETLNGIQSILDGLNRIDAAQKGGGGQTIVSKPIQDIGVAAEQATPKVKAVVDQMQALRDAGSTMGAGGYKGIIPVDPAMLDRLNQATKTTVDQIKQVSTVSRDAGKSLTDTTDAQRESAQRAVDDLEKIKQTTVGITEEEKKRGDILQENNRALLSGIGATQQQEAADKAVAAANKQISQAIKQQWEYRRLQYAGRAMTEVAQTFFVPSVAILTAAVAWAQNYVKNATTATEVTTQWKNATESLKYSQSRVGETLAAVELPALQMAARLASEAAAFVEAHPELVKDVLNIAGIVATLSGIGLLFAKGIRLYADINFMGATFRLTAAENELSIATAAQTAATEANTIAQGGAAAGEVVGGAEIGGGAAVAAGGAGLAALVGSLYALVPPLIVLGGELAYAKAKNIDLWKSFKQLTTLGIAPAIGGTIGLFDALFKGKNVLDGISKGVNDWIIKLGELLGVVTAPIPTVPTTQKSWYQAGLQDYIDYQKQLIANQKQYDDAMAQNDEEANAQILQINEAFNQSRVRQDRDHTLSEARLYEDYNDSLLQSTIRFGQQLQQEEQDYYKSRMEAAQQYGLEAARAEEDHQVEMKRLAEDHNDTMRDLTASRDALGMIREVRSYEKQRSRAEEDYLLAAKRRGEDYAKQLAQMEQNFAEQRAREIANFAQQQQDQETAFNKAKARRDADYKQQQADAEADRVAQINQIITAHNQKMDTLWQNLMDENTLANTAFIDRINALDNFVGTTTAAYIKYLKTAADQFARWLAAVEGIPYTPPKEEFPVAPQAFGGYAYPGLYYQRAEQGIEYVLNRPTTKYAEQIVGGRLTQQNLIAAMISGRSGGGTSGYTYNDRRTQTLSGLTAQDRLWAREMINRTVDERFKAEFK